MAASGITISPKTKSILRKIWIVVREVFSFLFTILAVLAKIVALCLGGIFVLGFLAALAGLRDSLSNHH